LGPVKGTGSKPFGNALPSNGAFNDALAELKEATANVRGDSVAVLSSNEALTQVTLQGVAYKCY